MNVQDQNNENISRAVFVFVGIIYTILTLIFFTAVMVRSAIDNSTVITSLIMILFATWAGLNWYFVFRPLEKKFLFTYILIFVSSLFLLGIGMIV